MRKYFYLFLAITALLFSACEQFGVDENPAPNPITNPEINLNSQFQTEFQTGDPVVYFTDIVLDANSQPLSEVVVSVFADDRRYTELTDEQGRYELTIPHAAFPTVGYISMSIVAENHKPFNVTYAAPLIAKTTYGSEKEILLNPCPNCLEVNGEKSAELFHLGDDDYGGPVNSQFQKATDGTTLSFQIQNDIAYSQLKLVFEAKGLQPDEFATGSSVVFGEGQEVFIDNSPEDGSYKMYSLTIDNNSQIQTITFKTTNDWMSGDNYDDWEFTCLHIEGIK